MKARDKVLVLSVFQSLFLVCFSPNSVDQSCLRKLWFNAGGFGGKHNLGACQLFHDYLASDFVLFYSHKQLYVCTT